MRMLMMVLVALVGWSSAAYADECKGVHARYAAKLKAAKFERKSFRKITLGYLKSLESAFAKCFSSKEGKALVAQRLKMQKSKAPPLRKKPDPREPGQATPPAKRIDLSSGGDGSTWSGSYNRTTVGGGSAALLSLMIPGAGQAVNNNALGWLFFLGTVGCYAGAGLLVGNAVDIKKGTLDSGMVTGGWVLIVVGGIIHVSSVIHAGVTAKR